MKCGYKYCKHGGEVSREDGIMEGARYFHADCLREKKAINAIIELFHERVDPKPIEAWLRKTVNDLVVKDGNDAEYLLFAFRYCLDHGWTLHKPTGLMYVAKDVTARKEWEKLHHKKIMEKVREQQKNMVVEEGFNVDNGSFKYIPHKATGFEDILR